MNVSESTTIQDETPPVENYTMDEVAAKLRVSRGTVRRMIRDGLLAAFKTTNTRQGPVRIPVESYEEYLRNQTVSAVG